MYSMPSRPNPIRDDSVRVAPDSKMSFTSTSARAIPGAAHQGRRAGHRRGAARGGRCIRIGDRLVIRDVDPLVLGEARVQDDVHQPLQPLRMHARAARYRVRVEHAVANDAETAGTFGDEDVAVGKECDRPRLLKLRHDDHAKIAMRGNRGFDDERSVAEHRIRPTESALHRHCTQRPESSGSRTRDAGRARRRVRPAVPVLGHVRPAQAVAARNQRRSR